MRLLGGVVLVGLGELLGDDQLGDVDSVAQEIGYVLLGVFHGAIWIPLDEDLPQALVHHPGHQGAVVSPHGFDALTVHFVVLIRTGVIEASVPFFVYQKVGKVDLLELQLNGLDKLVGDVAGGFLAVLHGIGHRVDAELDHNGVSVAIDDFGVKRVAVLDCVLALHFVLGLFDHHSAEGGDTLRNLQTRQLPNLYYKD